MNCKPGDLAIVVQVTSHTHLLGLVVEVLEPWGDGASWIVRASRPVTVKRVTNRRFATYDAYLRPIRDNDGEDEMLRIAGKPQPRKEIA